MSRRELDGRVALVSGASAGIGLCIAHLLSGSGARVMMTARTPQRLLAARDVRCAFVLLRTRGSIS